MVTIIKNNCVRQCKCEHCDSILQYSLSDVRSRLERNEVYEWIVCPACGKSTGFGKQIKI